MFIQKKYSICLILLISSFISNSQRNFIDYYNVANEAEYQFVEGKNLKGAKESFISLNKKYGMLQHKDNLYLGIIYYLDGDSTNGLKFLKKFIEQSGLATKYLPDCKKRFPDLLVSNNTIYKLESYEKDIAGLFTDTTFVNSKVKPVKDSIRYYVTLDQKNRLTSEKVDAKKDLLIQRAYLNYLKKNGMPIPFVVGDDYLTIFYHISDEGLKNEYLTYLNEQIIKGKACPFAYAIVADKIHTPNETIYGSYFPKSSDKTSEEQVILNRKKIGMSPYYNGSNLYPRIFPPEH